jgi:hypothetical protein
MAQIAQPLGRLTGNGRPLPADDSTASCCNGRRCLRATFEAMDEVEEYGYWNGTGSYPDGVTRPDWEMRYTPAMKAACEALYELDKDRLER